MANQGHKRLSRREVEVLALIARGFSNHDIAEALMLSEETVKSHVGHILAKLEAHTRAHAVAKWVGSGNKPDIADALIERARTLRLDRYAKSVHE